MPDEVKLDSQGVILEIRAGVGGEEAALFVADLYRAYSRYATINGWKQRTLEMKPTDLGGIKEITMEITGSLAWKKMQYEGGVHRVQRIPKTEKRDRIHTSTVSVAILEKPEKTEIQINPQDLRVEFYRASGPGGQYVQKRETAVRITHLPTGLIASSQTERNQLQNKENALDILRAKLFKAEREKIEKKLQEERRGQIKKAERSEKIRTYNFPQNRLTDHRIKKSWHNLEEIMEGNLEKIIRCLIEADKA